MKKSNEIMGLVGGQLTQNYNHFQVFGMIGNSQEARLGNRPQHREFVKVYQYVTYKDEDNTLICKAKLRKTFLTETQALEFIEQKDRTAIITNTRVIPEVYNRRTGFAKDFSTLTHKSLADNTRWKIVQGIKAVGKAQIPLYTKGQEYQAVNFKRAFVEWQRLVKSMGYSVRTAKALVNEAVRN